MNAMIQHDISRDRPHMELKCRVDTTLLGLMRNFVCSVARHVGFSEQEIAEIEISVDEACANAMEHAYEAEHPADRDVQVELYICSDRLTIRISDNGSGTPELDYSMSVDSYLDINREKFRGLGVVLMKKFMDELHIKATPGKGTVVEMTKLRH